RDYNGNNYFYNTQLYFGQAATYRFREIYFTIYTPLNFLLFLIGISFGVLKFKSHLLKITSYVPLSLVWSFFSFILLFVFYISSPSLSSRYGIDFLASIMGIISTLILLGSKYWIEPQGPRHRTLRCIFFGLFFVA